MNRRNNAMVGLGEKYPAVGSSRRRRRAVRAGSDLDFDPVRRVQRRALAIGLVVAAVLVVGAILVTNGIMA